MNVISRAELARWLDAQAGRMTLIAPTELDGVLLYRPVEGSAEVAWDFTRPVLSIKEFFFPSTERLLTIDVAGQSVQLTETLPEGQAVLFGVRPCDARGLRALDALFLESEPPDPYYARRRQNTTLVGLACRELGPTCFCTGLGGAPVLRDAGDMDVMLTEVEGGYTARAVTARGEALLADVPHLTAEAQLPGDAQLSAAGNLTGVPDPRVIPWPELFDDPYWERLGERCLSCRLCAYVCPTCRCFDVRDEALESGNGHARYERLRCWDSCAGEPYRRIAGGHNPRPAKGQRLRNRFFCKFYYYPHQVGPLACTGCGRCVEVCPVNVDITEVLADLARLKEAET